MNGFIDIHTHLLPDVDDGPGSVASAMRLLRMAWRNGTRAIVLTPHYRDKYRQNTPAMLEEKLEWLRELIATELPEMELYLGQELAYQNDIMERLHQGKVLSMNGSGYALLEFAFDASALDIKTGVYETVHCGYIPIVAHVERCNICRRDPRVVPELLELGALLQLNADSVMGRNGFRIKRFCHRLLKWRKAHFIASDAHDAVHRPPQLRECYLKVHKKYGAEYAAGLFCENARAVIENRTVD